jgi:hypothetical protein
MCRSYNFEIYNHNAGVVPSRLECFESKENILDIKNELG